jgi:hypothetical protein
MYSTCLFCTRPFGANDSIEVFPIGRRLAFDAVKGRLWVVCAQCTRWCLVPIEERWEAIETCERAFRDSRTRVSTGQIGLAKLRDGLELVRLGAPLRPELAAWRYGREFTARRRRTVALALTAAGVGAGGVAAGIAAGVGGTALALFATGAPVLNLVGVFGIGLYRVLDNARAIRVPYDGKIFEVNREELKQTALIPTDDAQAWGLELKHAWGRVTLVGDEAVRATTRLLARANGAGAAARTTQSAVASLGTGANVTEVLHTIAQRAASATSAHHASMRKRNAELETSLSGLSNEAGALMLTDAYRNAHLNPASLALMPAVDRLAFEMALHEERERHAMEGELAPLLAAWEEADRIAGIADALLVPDAVSEKLAALQAERSKGR